MTEQLVGVVEREPVPGMVELPEVLRPAKEITVSELAILGVQAQLNPDFALL